MKLIHVSASLFLLLYNNECNSTVTLVWCMLKEAMLIKPLIQWLVYSEHSTKMSCYYISSPMFSTVVWNCGQFSGGTFMERNRSKRHCFVSLRLPRSTYCCQNRHVLLFAGVWQGRANCKTLLLICCQWMCGTNQNFSLTLDFII